MQRILRSALAALPLFLLAALLFLPSPAAAQPNCSGFCNPLAPCNMTCIAGSQYKTCLQYNGVCNRDPDADGVDWLVDNCPTTANANQADCDGDGKGNVCDNLNGAFAPVGNRIACASTKDEYPFYTEFIVTYQQRHVDTSSCGAPDRWNHARNIEACYGDCDGLEDNACGGACINISGWQCSDVAICGDNFGTNTCNPDTI